MAVTTQLVSQGHDHLRYLVTSDGGGGGSHTIANATLQSDAIAGPIWEIARAKLNGIGTVAAGTGLTQAQARDILCADDSGASVGNQNVPRCKLQTVARTGAATVIADANVDGSGNPVIAVALSAASSTAYLDVIFIGGIGTT